MLRGFLAIARKDGYGFAQGIPRYRSEIRLAVARKDGWLSLGMTAQSAPQIILQQVDVFTMLQQAGVGHIAAGGYDGEGGRHGRTEGAVF